METTTRIVIPFHHDSKGNLFTETFAVNPELQEGDEIADLVFDGLSYGGVKVLSPAHESVEKQMFKYEIERHLRGLIIRTLLPHSVARIKREQAVIKYNTLTGQYWMSMPNFPLGSAMRICLTVHRRPRTVPLKRSKDGT